MNILFIRGRHFLSLFMIVALILCLNTASSLAQDDSEQSVEGEVAAEEPPVAEPTDTPTPDEPTPEPAPTETQVVEPIETATVIPPEETEPAATDVVDITETVTVPPESTAESTSEATATTTEVNPELTEEPTEPPTPTLEPEPGLKLLYMENFTDAVLPNWTLGSGWTATPNDADFALQTVGDSTSELWLYDSLFDVALQAQVKVNNGAVRLVVRHSSAAEGYAAELQRDGDVKLYRAGTEIADATIDSFNPDDWHTLRFSVIGRTLRVRVDGNELIAIQDDETLPPGKVAVDGSDNADALVDAFAVAIPVDQEIPPTVTPPQVTPGTDDLLPTEEVTPEVTPELTPEATEEFGAIAQAATIYTVNNKNDVNDGLCDATHCSLREAMEAANANSGTDTIEFDIPAEAAPFTIFPLTCALPFVTDPVVIDGYTQPGASVAVGVTPAILRIQIDGQSAQGQGGPNCPAAPDGIRILAGGSGSTIRGLSIIRFLGNGIQINQADNVTVEGNFIGLEVEGSADFGNGQDGVLIDGGTDTLEQSTGNLIGGTSDAARNIISGNGNDGIEVRNRTDGSTIIRGNYIGLDKGGTTDRGNGANGVQINNTPATVGGTMAGARNIIAGNSSDGVEIRNQGANFSVVQGNYIGLNAAGNARVPNDADGVYITGSGGNLIGGTTGVTLGGACTGACNVITGNGSDGIELAPLGGLSVLDNQVWGNFIGLNPAGTGVVTTSGITGNVASGIRVNAVAEVTIGGTIPAQRNIISGNQGNGSSGSTYGIQVLGNSTNTKIYGNFIGTNSAGNAAVPNRTAGVYIVGSGVFVGDSLGSQYRNIISGNTGVGIEISGSTSQASRIRGNFIGTDATGQTAVPNGDGVRINGSVNNFVGDAVSTNSRNVISGNTGDAVEIIGATAEGNRVQLNYIGVAADGTTSLPNNGNGVRIATSAKRNQVGYDINENPLSQIGSNVIANNTLAGVAIETDAGTGNSVMNNVIYSNGGLGIDLGTTGVTPNDANDTDTGPNNLQNFPVLTNVNRSGGTVTIQGSIQGPANMHYRIDFFVNATCDPSGNGEGPTYLGSINDTAADGAGLAQFNINFSDALFGASDFFTMTATDKNNVGGFPEYNTSEFSKCIDRNNNPPTISNIADQATRGNHPVNDVPFTVGDVETSAGALTLSAVSSNTSIIPNENITFGGSGASRTVNFFAAAGVVLTPQVVTITVRVTDAGGAYNEDSFVVNLSVNQPPVISPTIPDQTTAFGAQKTVNFTINDPDDEESILTMSVQSSSNLGLVPLSNVSFDGSDANRSVIIQPAPGQSGFSDIKIRVSDGDRFGEDTFRLTVSANTAPTVTPASFSTQTTGMNTPKIIAFTANDTQTPPDQLIYSVTSNTNTTLLPNNNIVFGGSGTSRTVTLTPANNQTGSVTIQISVSDGFLSAVRSIVLNVNPNAAPTFTPNPITAKTTTEGVPVSFSITINDDFTPVANLVLAGTSSNTTLVPNANILFSGTTTSRTVTIYPVGNLTTTQTSTITINVTDGGGLTTSRSFTLTVNTSTNAPPTISNIVDQNTTIAVPVGPLNFTVGDSTDPAGNLIVTATSSNQTLIPDGNISLGGTDAARQITVTPASAQTGTATITVFVRDSSNAYAIDRFDVTVAGNNPPSISDIVNQTTPWETPKSVSFTVGDDQGPNSLTITGASSNDALVPDANVVITGTGSTRTVTLTPSNNQSGTTTITITVEDAGSLQVSDTFILTVNPNTPPVISDITNRLTTVNIATGQIPFTVNDVETPSNLTVTAASSNPTLVPNGNIVLGGSGTNRTINVIPASGQIGTTTITVTVKDPDNAQVTDTFDLVVTTNNPPTISSIDDIFTPPGVTAGPVVFTIGDVETPLGNLLVDATSSNTSLLPNENIVLGGSGAERSLTLFPMSGQSGTTTITVIVTDEVAAQSSETFVLNVNVAPPVPTAPVNLATVTTLKPKFTWTKVTGAAQYRIQVDDNNTFSSPDINTTTTSTSFTAATNLPQGTYFWRVRGLNGSGNDFTDWSVVLRFTINILKTPANNSFLTDTTPSFSWNSVSGATYQLQVDDDNTFNAPEINQTTTSTSFTPGAGLALDFDTYYWRVNVNGVNSPVFRQFVVTPPTPGAPALDTPANNAVIGDSTPQLNWFAASGTDGTPFTYEVQVDNDSKFGSPEFVGLPGELLTTTVFPALSDNKYNWRVRALNSYGAPGAWSSIRVFTLDTIPPDIPTLKSPNTGTLTNDTTPTFSWNTAPGASSYRIDVSSNSNFSSFMPGLNNVTVNATTFTVPDGNSLPNGVYYWRVRAADLAGNISDDSLSRTITINILTAPSNGSFSTDRTPTFQWSPVSGANFVFQLTNENDPAFNSPLTVNGCGATTATSCTPTSDLAFGRYLWRVNINGVNAQSSWLIIISPSPVPDPPTLRIPANNGLTTDNTPSLGWTATASTTGSPFRYEIQVDNDSNFSSPVFTQISAASATSQTVTPALADGKYYWRARTLNQYGAWSAWTSSFSFTVDTIPPAVPVLNSPVNNAISTDSTPQFKWNTVSGAKRYLIDVSTSPTFNTFVIGGAQVTTTTYTVANASALTNGMYYWRVRSVDEAGNVSAASTPRTLVIAAP